MNAGAQAHEKLDINLSGVLCGRLKFSITCNIGTARVGSRDKDQTWVMGGATIGVPGIKISS